MNAVNCCFRDNFFFHGDYDPCPVSFFPYGRIILLKSIQDLWHGILYFQDVNDMRLLLAVMDHSQSPTWKIVANF